MMEDVQLELAFPDEGSVFVRTHEWRVEELTSIAQDHEVLRMAKDFAQDGYETEYIDDAILLGSCARLRYMTERDTLNCFIAYRKGEPVGFLVGVAGPMFYRPGIVAEQKLCYVKPTARGSVAIKYLIRAFEQWAKMVGATQLYTGTANTRYAERTSKLLTHLGYPKVGALHFKEL